MARTAAIVGLIVWRVNDVGVKGMNSPILHTIDPRDFFKRIEKAGGMSPLRRISRQNSDVRAH